MDSLATLSGLGNPLFLVLLLVYFGSMWLGRQSCRPGLFIVNRQCPSFRIMPLWTVVSFFSLVAWLGKPDLTGITALVKACVDKADPAYVKTCANYALYPGFVGFVTAIAFSFVLVHSVMTYLRVKRGITIAKWPALLICEISKASFAALFLAGAQKFEADEIVTGGSTFYVSLCIVFTALIAVSLLRIAAVIKIAGSPEGLTAEGFNSEYFGTDRKCPFATWVACGEKDSRHENSGDYHDLSGL